MSIWKKPISVQSLNDTSANTATSHLGIELTEVGDDFVRGRVPVDERTRQPFGLLHGGVSVVLAAAGLEVQETIALDLRHELGRPVPGALVVSRWPGDG